MKKVIAGEEELKECAINYKKFLKSLDLNEEQIEEGKEFLKSLIRYINKISYYGLEAYNKDTYNYIEFKEMLKMMYGGLDGNFYYDK